MPHFGGKLANVPGNGLATKAAYLSLAIIEGTRIQGAQVRGTTLFSFVVVLCAPDQE